MLPSLVRDDDKELALLLRRQQQLEQTPDPTKAEGVLDIQRIATLIQNEDEDDLDDGTQLCNPLAEPASADSLLDIAGMSISYDSQQQQQRMQQSSGDTTSLDDSLDEDEHHSNDAANDNAAARPHANVKKSTRSAFALFWEGGLLYTVCMVLPTVLHWVMYDNAGNLWMEVAYTSTRTAVLDTFGQIGNRVQEVVCSNVDCLEWKTYMLEKVEPVIDYLCESEEIDPFGIYVHENRPDLQWSDYLSPFYWAHYMGLCPVVEVEEVIPPRPVVSPDITGWEHDVHIIVAMSLVLTLLRLIFGLLMTEWLSSTPPTVLEKKHNSEIDDAALEEPLDLQVIVRKSPAKRTLSEPLVSNREMDPLATSEDNHPDIMVSPTAETMRVVNIKRLSRRVPHERDLDQESTGAQSERSKSSRRSIRSARSLRSIRSAMSATGCKMRGLRQRIFKNKRSQSRSTDSISTTRSRSDSIAETDNHSLNETNPQEPQQETDHASLWNELHHASARMMQQHPHAWEATDEAQPTDSEGMPLVGRDGPLSTSPAASLDSSISTKHDWRSVETSQPDRDRTRSREVSPSNASSLDVSELFQLLCSIVAVAQAWVSFRDSDFWPWYVGGQGTTANCWDLSGGLSVGMDSDFDHRNAVLKQYFLVQASYHLFSATLEGLKMVQSLWQRYTSQHDVSFLCETTKLPLMFYFRSLIQHLLVLVVFAVAFIFSSLRRLVAVGVFAFDASKLCFHLCQTISSSSTTRFFTRDLFSLVALPSFVAARFAVWPALWYSAAYESSDWLTQLEQTLWPGSADTFRKGCHVWMALLLIVSLFELRRMVVGIIRRVVDQSAPKPQQAVSLERKNA